MTLGHVLSIIFGILLIAYGLKLRKQSRIDHSSPAIGFAEWPLQPIDFALLMWVLFMFLLLLPPAASSLLMQNAGDAQLDAQARNEQIALVSILSTHLPILLFFGILLYSPMRGMLGKLSSVKTTVSTWVGAAKQSWKALLKAFPIFMLLAFGWHYLLVMISELGIPINTDPQLLVTMMEQTESMAFVMLIGFAAVFLAPITEELLFRGILFRYLRLNVCSLTKAAWISGALFSAIHFHWGSLLPLAYLGYVLAKNYDHFGDIRIPILMHMFFNAISTIMMQLVRL